MTASKNVVFFRMSEIAFWAWRVGHSSMFQFLLDKNMKTEQTSRCQFMRDAWANIDEMPKTHSEKDLIDGPKMMPKTVPE